MEKMLRGLEFCITPQEAQDYAAVTQTGHLRWLPAGIGMKLLTSPKVQTWLSELMGQKVPVHVDQAYEFFKPLQAGETLSASIECKAISADCWQIITSFSTLDGNDSFTMRTTILGRQSVSDT
jgi:hypothetical protein